MLDQRFDPAEAEPRLYEAWEKEGCFKPSGDPDAEVYSIVIPPPNVTGVLHMGHALNNTLQDLLIRFERMRGKNVLWQPGTDHAGIATQMVVERQLAQEGNQDRRAMGREAFVDRVWQWKAESGGAIVNQLKRLGASCDWSRERFTMDEGLSKAVTKVFVDLHKKGLIYRDKRLVNWDPHFQTAISDLEVDSREVKGHMWHFKYPLAGGATYTYVEKDADGNVILEEERDYISIATTRPETMLGDGAVAVHPDDERYKPIVGMLCEIPVGPKEHRRLIPIITDDYPDPDFGSGAVKITGAHDENDYGVAQRNGIPMYRLMDERAQMRTDGGSYAEAAARAKEIAGGAKASVAEVDALNLVPEAYRGLDRYEARKRVIEDIDAEGLMIEIEDKLIMQPFGDRSNVVIEPMLTDQWFVDAETLAQPAIAAVREGKTRFVPENWEKTYYNWMENIQPWCVSRQLWWGHRIPAWYGPDLRDLQDPSEFDENPSTRPQKAFVAGDEASLRQQLADYYAVPIAEGYPLEFAASKEAAIDLYESEKQGPCILIYQDEDVLDTWFSSALWPFSTQGWPDQTEDLKTFYPTSTLVTAFDIIFFWVSRMMMMGLEFTHQVPFRDVYIHALVLDEKGQKMSKSKGNVMDPLDLINEYGADALRFAMSRLAGQGRNIRLSKQVVEGNRNFATKLWNAARFAEMNECGAPAEVDFAAVDSPVNRWILGELSACVAEVTKGIEDYRFNDAAGALYKFIWNTYCDWYLELIKPLLGGMDDGAKAETRTVCGYVLDETLKLLHPFMPFVTEELWERRTPGRAFEKGYLMRQDWPAVTGFRDEAADAEVNWVIDLITEIRSLRNDLGVPAGARIPLALVKAGGEIEARAMRHEDVLKRMARLEDIAFTDASPEGAVTAVFGETVAALSIADFVDIAEARKRIDKELAQLDKDIKGTDRKLANADFVARAPAEIVEENRQRLVDWQARREKLQMARKGLEGL